MRDDTEQSKPTANNGSHRAARKRKRSANGTAQDESRIDWAATAGSLGTFIRQQARERPYTTLAAGAAAGYILGGGLPRVATRMAVDIGVRMAMTALAAQLDHDMNEEE